MKKIAIILAGGEGRRAGGEEPKQFQKVNGMPMYWWSLKAFKDEDPDTQIILVCHPGAFDLLDALNDELPINQRIEYQEVCGGKSRWQSVNNALMEVDAADDVLVAIHDSARPLVTKDIISRGWESAMQCDGAIPVVDVTDSLRLVDAYGGSHSVDRSLYKAVQTPQVFRASIIKRAYALGESPLFTDDASVAEAAGYKPVTYAGEATNIKVTHPRDFAIATLLLKK